MTEAIFDHKKIGDNLLGFLLKLLSHLAILTFLFPPINKEPS